MFEDTSEVLDCGNSRTDKKEKMYNEYKLTGTLINLIFSYATSNCCEKQNVPCISFKKNIKYWKSVTDQLGTNHLLIATKRTCNVSQSDTHLAKGDF